MSHALAAAPGIDRYVELADGFLSELH